MRRALLVLVLCIAAGAGTGIGLPRLGCIRDGAGHWRELFGVRGNFLVGEVVDDAVCARSKAARVTVFEWPDGATLAAAGRRLEFRDSAGAVSELETEEPVRALSPIGEGWIHAATGGGGGYALRREGGKVEMYALPAAR